MKIHTRAHTAYHIVTHSNHTLGRNKTGDFYRQTASKSFGSMPKTMASLSSLLSLIIITYPLSLSLYLNILYMGLVYL